MVSVGTKQALVHVVEALTKSITFRLPSLFQALLQKRIVATPLFLGADQKVTRFYRWSAGTVEMNRS